MKDRVPKYPGRVRLVPVAGLADTFDMVRADEAVEAGTALNKAALLKDSTAAALGLPVTAVPDDAFNIFLKTAFIKEVAPYSLNYYYWTLIAHPTKRQPRAAVGYYNGMWITGGMFYDQYDASNRSLKMYYSYDSKNWIKGDTSEASQITETYNYGTAVSICRGSDRFVAIIEYHPNYSQSISVRSIWSRDGVAWKIGNQITTGGQSLHGEEVVYFKGYYYVAIDKSLYRSTDGITWALYKTSGALGVGESTVLPHMLADGGFLIISTNGQEIITTTDAVNFVPVAVGSSYHHLAYKDGTFAVSTTNGLKLTKDFKTFETITHPGIVGLGATKDYFITTRRSNSEQGAISLSSISKDGKNWFNVSTPNPGALGGGTISGGGGVLWAQVNEASMLYLDLNPDRILTNLSGRPIASLPKVDVGTYYGTGYAEYSPRVVLHFDFTVKAFILIGNKYNAAASASPSMSMAVAGADSITIMINQYAAENNLIRLKDNTVTLEHEFNGNAVKPYHYSYIAMG